MKMKKNRLFAIIALLLAFLLVFAGCANHEAKDDRDEGQLESTPTQDADENEDEIEYEIKEVWLCVRDTIKQWDGSGTSVYEYEYDEFGNQISMKDVAGDREWKYEYDAAGNQIRAKLPSGAVTEMTYDKEGHLLSSITTGSDGQVKMEYHYTYDKAGFVIEEVYKEYFIDFESQYVSTYNADHTERETVGYQNGEMTQKIVASLNANGDLLKSDTYDTDGTWMGGIECEYDDAGRITLERVLTPAEVQNTIYTYDENGLLISKNTDYYYGSETTYEYERFEIKVRVN